MEKRLRRSGILRPMKTSTPEQSDNIAIYARPSTVAKMLGVTTRTVSRLAASGKLIPRKLNARTVLYSRAEVSRFVESCACVSTPAPASTFAADIEA